MSTVLIAVLKPYSPGPNTDWEAGQIVEIEARDAQRYVDSGVACFYSEFKSEMVQKTSDETSEGDEATKAPTDEDSEGDEDSKDDENNSST